MKKETLRCADDTIKMVHPSKTNLKEKHILKMKYCLYCNKRGHSSYACWSKNKYLKEINRNKEGKLTKKYVPRYSKDCLSIINRGDIDEKEQHQTAMALDKTLVINLESNHQSTIVTKKLYIYLNQIKPN